MTINTEDESQSAIDLYITPSTPVAQAGTFGAIEPPMSAVPSDFTVPVTEYKWNQIDEIQLSNGKKVCS